MFFIRAFQPEDFNDIVEIERHVFSEHDPYVYMELYESVPDGFYVAIMNGKTVGYVVGFISITIKGRIFTLCVKEEYRGMGIGTRLMDKICATLKENGSDEATLEVRISNISAQHFYFKRGFIPAWIERGYYSDGEDALVMRREL
jgi:ribosomal-protein-alanine N-acetyltransferase